MSTHIENLGNYSQEHKLKTSGPLGLGNTSPPLTPMATVAAENKPNPVKADEKIEKKEKLLEWAVNLLIAVVAAVASFIYQQFTTYKPIAYAAIIVDSANQAIMSISE